MAYQEYLDRTVKKIATLDFSSERKTMSTVVIGYDGKVSNTVLLKGAPERVIEKCSTVSTNSGMQSALTAASKAELIEKIKKVAGQGYRVLGIAIGLDGGNMKSITT
jgi:magnesium-transporting ATPase (P-type)